MNQYINKGLLIKQDFWSRILILFALGYLAICPLLTFFTYREATKEKMKEREMINWTEVKGEVYDLSEHAHVQSRISRSKCYSFSYRAIFNGLPLIGLTKHNSIRPYGTVTVFVNPSRPDEFRLLGDARPIVAYAIMWILPTFGELFLIVCFLFFWLLKKGYGTPFDWLGKLFALPAFFFRIIGNIFESAIKGGGHLFDRLRGRFLYKTFWVSNYRVKTYLPFNSNNASQFTVFLEKNGRRVSKIKVPLSIDPTDGPDTRDWSEMKDRVEKEIIILEEKDRVRQNNRIPWLKLSYWSLRPGTLGQVRFGNTEMGRFIRKFFSGGR